MPVEIERKFLVLKRTGDLPKKRRKVRQGYFDCEEPTIRVRLVGDLGFLTIKAAQLPEGFEARPEALEFARSEYEYEIPAEHAKQLLMLCPYRLDKVRYYFDEGFELDIFEGRHSGLELLEYESAEAAETMPPFPSGLEVIEVSRDPRYSNARLSRGGIPKR